MARPALDFESTLTYELYQVWVDDSEKRGTVTNPNAFCTLVLPAQGYHVSPSTFRYHTRQMKDKGVLTFDRLTGAAQLPEVEVRRRKRLAS
jgi:hypothetical protein